MSNLDILSDNRVTDNDVEFSMITGTENANFPLTNIKQNFTTKVFRSNENQCEILIDMKTISSVNSFAVVGHALTGLGVTSLSLTLSATNDFTGLTEKIIDLNHQYNFGSLYFDPEPARYAKLKLTNTGSFCELSNIFIGDRIEFIYNGFSQDSFTFSRTDFSSVSSNEYGQDFVNLRNQIKNLSGQIKFANKQEVEDLDYIITKHLNYTPVWVLIDHCDTFMTDGKYKLSGYYRVSNRPNFRASGAGLFDITLSFKEVV